MGKYFIVPFFWVASALLIGYTSIITVLPGLITLSAKRPGWIVLGLAAGAEFFSIWQTGVATVAILIPWLTASLIKPVIDISFRFLLWCSMVVLLQMVWILMGEFNIFFEARGFGLTLRSAASHLPRSYLAWVTVVSIAALFGGAIWRHFNYPEAT